MQLKPNEIHIWSQHLTVTSKQIQNYMGILSKDEKDRANRFYFPLHQQRFIVARASLRQILSLYLSVPPAEIIFKYDAHGKPYLGKAYSLPLQFNLSHSENLALYALTLDYNIGIDVEKIQASYDAKVAKRYFSSEENAELHALSGIAEISTFYSLWARKEAVIKALGKGLSLTLASFSIPHHKNTLLLENKRWALFSLELEQGYKAALATNQEVKSLSFWQLYEPI